jgi:hypothetical protein
VAGINVSVLKDSGDDSSPPSLRDDLVEEGRKLSALLGYQGDYPLITVGPPSQGGI